MNFGKKLTVVFRKLNYFFPFELAVFEPPDLLPDDALLPLLLLLPPLFELLPFELLLLLAPLLLLLPLLLPPFDALLLFAFDEEPPLFDFDEEPPLFDFDEPPLLFPFDDDDEPFDADLEPEPLFAFEEDDDDFDLLDDPPLAAFATAPAAPVNAPPAAPDTAPAKTFPATFATWSRMPDDELFLDELLLPPDLLVDDVDFFAVDFAFFVAMFLIFFLGCWNRKTSN